MTFRWLPDAEQYLHPRRAWLFQLAFDVVVARMFRVDHDVTPDNPVPPGTLIISNHLRDADGPILGTLVCCRKGLHIRRPLPFFALREDLLERGALANLLHTWPRPLADLLRRVSLKWLLDNVRAVPMRRLREFSWQDTLRELLRAGLGECPPQEVFNARGLRELHGQLGHVPARVDAINAWQLGALRVAPWGWRRLAAGTRGRLALPFRATVAAQLRELAKRLDAGGTVYFAPEGHVSMDGRLGRIRAGSWRLAGMTTAPLEILPLVFSYDPLGPGRTRVLVRRGEAWRVSDMSDSRSLTRGLSRGLLAHRVVTPSHLLAWFLSARKTPFTTSDMVVWLDQALLAARASQREVDPIATRMSSAELVTERLRWLARKGLLKRSHGSWHSQLAPHAKPSWQHAAGIVRYLASALADFAPHLTRSLPACN